MPSLINTCDYIKLSAITGWIP